ncbi:hypothetical protein [Prochlorococcus sp. MIT 1300]|uniref:hypothetical protein n=1 Tax=Prochlorococcus sp. MIT 1300 TaxID=3096218 RepID=UPI002A761ACB|nr:hypothetical protein [Prochlorococcus sp. MIT 1300]
MMTTIAIFLLSLTLALISFVSSVNALLPSVRENMDNQKIENDKDRDQSSIDYLLGPKDKFPFLPDNHRDSGTGKFNSF